jgi:intracellular septation protein
MAEGSPVPGRPSRPGAASKPPAWLKPATDWGPLAAFFAAYWIVGLLPATAVLLVVAIAVSVLTLVLERRIPWMPVFTAAAVGIFGGLSLVFDDEAFIKLRPTIVQTLMAAVLLAGLAMRRLFLKFLLAQGIHMTDRGWKVLTWRFAAFLLFSAALNELVWRTQTNDTWATFDTFGPLGLTLLFGLAQAPLINRHAAPAAEDTAAE